MTASCSASSEDGTIVDRLWAFHDSSEITLNCTANEAEGANCAAHDTILKFFGITEREQTLLVGSVERVTNGRTG